MNDVIKIVKSLDSSVLLITHVTQTATKETKQEIWSFGMYFGNLAATLWENILSGLAGAGVIGAENGIIKPSKKIISTLAFS